MHRRAPATLALALLALAPPVRPAWALYSDGASYQQQDIGYSAPGAVAYLPGLDFTGIGKSVDVSAGGRWCTAISQDFVVSATHYPAQGLMQWTGSDGTVVQDQIVSTTYNVGGTDLCVSKLATPLPSTVATYTIPTSDMVPYGTIAYVAGLVWGLGVGEAMVTVLGNSGMPGLWMVYSTNGPPMDHRSYPTNGDSGAPSFVEIGGKLALVGVHYTGGFVFGDSDLTSQIPNINAAMIAMGSSEQVTVTPPPGTPEPASWALLAGGLGLGAARRLRRRGRPGVGRSADCRAPGLSAA